MIAYLPVAVVGYLLGALPFGWLVARLHGVDIFQVGSRSPGATNVRRVLGARAGNLVFVLDAAKGAAVATGTGGLLVLLPGSTLVAAVVWVLAFYTTGYVSLASILAAVALPLAAALVFGSPKPILIAAILISLFVIARHRDNIGRLVAGTENKFQKKKEDRA